MVFFGSPKAVLFFIVIDKALLGFYETDIVIVSNYSILSHYNY